MTTTGIIFTGIAVVGVLIGVGVLVVLVLGSDEKEWDEKGR